MFFLSPVWGLKLPQLTVWLLPRVSGGVPSTGSVPSATFAPKSAPKIAPTVGIQANSDCGHDSLWCGQIARRLQGSLVLSEEGRFIWGHERCCLLWWFWQQFTNLFSLLSRTSHIWPPTSARWWVSIASCMMIIAYLRVIIITIFIMSIMVTIIMAMIRRCSRTWASSLSSSLTTCPASPEEVTRCEFVLRSLFASMCCWSYRWVLLSECGSYQVFLCFPDWETLWWYQ